MLDLNMPKVSNDDVSVCTNNPCELKPHTSHCSECFGSV